MQKKLHVLLCAFIMCTYQFTAQQTTSILTTNETSDSSLGYVLNQKGARLIDFSKAGYKGGGVKIPNFHELFSENRIIKIFPSGEDDRQAIQDAINTISTWDLMTNGYRGGIELQNGVFYVSKHPQGKVHTFEINKSGIVIKGISGNLKDDAKTIIIQKDKSTSTFYVNGFGAIEQFNTKTPIKVDQPYVPVGTKTIRLARLDTLEIGDNIMIYVKPTQKWVDNFPGWNLGEFSATIGDDKNIRMERKITKINPSTNTIGLDASITTQIDIANGYSNAVVYPITDDQRTRNIGFQDFILAADFDCSEIITTNQVTINCITEEGEFNFFNDSLQSARGIDFYRGKDGWAKNLTGMFFRESFITSNNIFHQLTVQDCAMLDGVSEDNIQIHKGGDDYSFNISSSNSLVQRCYSRNARHSFTLNNTTSMVVFLDCLSEKEHLSLEPHQKWAHGVLYDNVKTDGQFKLQYGVDPVEKIFHNQKAANSVLWNITSNSKRRGEPFMYLDKPKNDLGYNWVIGYKFDGCSDNRIANPSDSIHGDIAYVEAANEYVYPRSLFLRQLKDRLGIQAVNNITISLQRDMRKNVIEERIFDILHVKYRDIPEFMSIGQLVNYEHCPNNNCNYFNSAAAWFDGNANYNASEFKIGDFDGDNKDDILALKKDSERFVIWTSKGDENTGARFDPGAVWFDGRANYSSSEFKVGDFNGDGKDDIIAINKHSERFVIWTSKGDANTGARFNPGAVWFDGPFDYNTSEFKVGDFNGDGKDDVLAIKKDTERFVIWTSKGDQNTGARFNPGAVWFDGNANYSTSDFKIGDFDGDHLEDIMMIIKGDEKFITWYSKGDQNTGVRFTTGSEGFNRDISSNGSIIFNDVEFSIGKFNDDNLDDVISIQKNSEKFDVWISIGNSYACRNFSINKNWYDGNANYNSSELKTGDFNGDGLDEVVAINKGSEMFIIWKNNTTPPSQSSRSISKNALDSEDELVSPKNVVKSTGQIKNIQVYNFYGTLVQNLDKEDVSNGYINFSNYKHGLYIIKITYDDGEITTDKFIRSNSHFKSWIIK